MSEIKFDPQTGEPVAPKQQPAQPAEPVPAQAQPAPKKGNGGKIAAVIIAAVVLLGGGAFAAKSLLGGGLGGGTPYEQIKAAAKKTFVSDDLTDQVKMISQIMKDGTYAVDASFTVSGQDFSFDLDVDKGNLSLSGSGAEYDGALYMDSEKVILESESLGIDPLSYSYTSDKSGAADSYLGSMIGSESLSEIDSLLKLAYSLANTDDSNQKEIEKQIDEQFEELVYEELDKEDFTVNDKTVRCGGYSTTVSGEFLADLVDHVAEKVLGRSLTDFISEVNAIGGSGAAEDPLANIRALKDIELDIYISDGRIFRVDIDTEDETGEEVKGAVSFVGEDIPWHETVFFDEENNETGRLSVEEDGAKTIYEFSYADGAQGSLEYDSDVGDLTCYSGDEVALRGLISSKPGNVDVLLYEASGAEVDVDVTFSEDAEVAEAPEARDILTLSESDVSELVSGIYSLLFGL